MSFFLDFLNLLFGRKPRTPSAPSGLPADSPDEPAQITRVNVLLLIYNPVLDAAGGERLADRPGWSRPDDLVNTIASDLLNASQGLVRYQIAERLELDEFPVLADGFRYTPQTYLDVLSGRTAAHSPARVDYRALLQRFDLLQRVGRGELDEVWVMAPPHVGFYESIMAGSGAFWCNAPPLPDTASCARRFVIMGFSYERGPGEALESYGHRAESILGKVFNCQSFITWAYTPNRQPPTVGSELNLFQRFLCFDQIAPGRAAVGTIHHAPNSLRDYDWGNPTPVRSECYDWLNFPHFKGDVRMVTASEWGGGDIRAHHLWWFAHIPKSAGRKNGIHNNWWQYIANPNNVMVR